MAKDWRGWDGTRSWGSLEGELSIDASCDRLGHTTFVVELVPGVADGWSARGSLVVDAGDLAPLPAQAAALVAGR